MGHMTNRQSQAFSYNAGNNCTRNRLNCTQLCLVQLAVDRAVIPESHSIIYIHWSSDSILCPVFEISML